MEYFYLNNKTDKWSVIRDIYEGFNLGVSKDKVKIPFGYTFKNTLCIKAMKCLLDKKHFKKLLKIISLSRITLALSDEFKMEERYIKKTLREYVDTLDIATWIKVIFKIVITLQRKDIR